MKLNQPTVGPILGYTTGSESRIWFRGQFEAAGNSSYRRCFGLLRYRKAGGAWSAPLFNKMSPNFDMSCVLAPQGLAPETHYEYQAAWLFLEAELDKLNTIDSSLFEWPNAIYSLKTASTNAAAPRTYAVGSCRYLLKTFIGNIFDDRGDKIFKSILNQHGHSAFDGVVMMGDQIYADDLNFAAPDNKLSEFLLRYRTVFTQEYIRALMGKIPTYMTLDDHEIEDNWPAKATERDRVTLYPNAMHAYQIYQCSHSPLFAADADGRIEGSLQKFWYSFSDGCTDWFVTDSRTERLLNRGQPKMLKQEQLDALLNWLTDGSPRVKMIVTSVPFAPDLNAEADDKWGAFPAQRTAILDAISGLATPKVVFVSGDVHCSFTAEIRHQNRPKPIAYQVVSSSFFWPYPHMHKGDFITGTMITSHPRSPYQASITSQVISDDNFARLEISPDGMSASFYQRKGARLETVIIAF